MVTIISTRKNQRKLRVVKVEKADASHVLRDQDIELRIHNYICHLLLDGENMMNELTNRRYEPFLAFLS